MAQPSDFIHRFMSIMRRKMIINNKYTLIYTNFNLWSGGRPQ